MAGQTSQPALIDMSRTTKLAVADADLSADASPQLGGFLDPNGNFIGRVKGGDIASASPIVIDTDGDYFDVTGTTNFSTMTVAADRHFFLQFDSALTMTHNSTTLDLPGEANITTVAGDVGEFFSTGANTVHCVNYTRAAGIPVVGLFPTANFTSSEQTVTVDTTLDIAHNLGVIPSLFQVLLVNSTAEAGYADGNELVWASFAPGTGDGGAVAFADATNITLVQGDEIRIISDTTKNVVVLTTTSWRWIVRAWV